MLEQGRLGWLDVVADTSCRHEEERGQILSRLQDAEQEATDKLNEQRQAYEDRLKVSW